jgi:glc operon protein GlcG
MINRPATALALALLLAPSSTQHAAAEAPKPSRVGAASTVQRTITRLGARLAIEAAIAEATRRQIGLAISVVDAGGHLVAAERIDGTFSAGAHVSEGKARTAALFKKASAFFEKVIRDGRTPMIAVDVPGYTPLQGGVPIELNGQVLGTVGASGASSAAEDEELATIGANAVIAALKQTLQLSAEQP